MQKVIADDLNAFCDIFPHYIREPLCEQQDVSKLLEVVMDLGRPPEARFPDRETLLNTKEVDQEDIDFVTAHISAFGDDNRAGIERTLHRISAIRNREGRIVGLTCRVGRAVFGTIKIIQDFIETGNSVLLLGRPGVGKTTMLREVARVLADDINKRVIIVDTSNEIAGDGDIPHPAIGHARRMQVPTPNKQHAVMIEAVENHMPEVIVIDEIGTELEALAARTIAERGVQLVGTAHGNTLENLMMNPTLADLIGGIQSVTLSDEEARRRGTQKSILERKAPPTFEIVVEIQDWERVAIHPDVGEAVDNILLGHPAPLEIRWLDEKGEVRKERIEPTIGRKPGEEEKGEKREVMPAGNHTRMYLYGVERGRLEQIARDMRVDVEIADKIEDANLLVVPKSHYRRRPQPVKLAQATNLPIYVLRSSTPSQLKQLLENVYITHSKDKTDEVSRALEEAEEAVEQVRKGEPVVELSPQSAYIRRLQHLIAERSDLLSHSVGKEPQRRVKIYK